MKKREKRKVGERCQLGNVDNSSKLMTGGNNEKHSVAKSWQKRLVWEVAGQSNKDRDREGGLGKEGVHPPKNDNPRRGDGTY